MLLSLLALLSALALSAVFTAAELAVFSLGEARVRTLADWGCRGSNALAEIRVRPERLLVLTRSAKALAGVAAAAFAVLFAYPQWQVPGAVAAACVVVLVLFISGDFMPMALAASRRVRMALAVAPLLRILLERLAPLLRPLERLVRLPPETPGVGGGGTLETEIRQITALGETEGWIEEQERQLVERALGLDETRAWNIMTPRVDVFAWSDSQTLAAIAPELHRVPFSRVPVYGDSIDDVTGVLYLRDAYQALLSGQRDVPLHVLAREPLIVPGSVPLTKLLRDFQLRRIHLALVADEYGGIDGLITLEDVLEELVGEIVDETDVTDEPITRISRNEIVAAGDADLREINHFFNAALPQLEHRSLNGYLLEELDRVPEPGEYVQRDGIEIEVLEATETQVVRARLRRTTAASAEARSTAAAPATVRPTTAATGDSPVPGADAEPAPVRPPARNTSSLRSH